MKSFDKYYTNHMEPFEEFLVFGGAPMMPILPRAIGREWDDIVLGALHAYRPSSIRVTTGSMKLDSRIGRITVIVNEKNIIREILMEVDVGIPGETDEEINRNHELVQYLIGDD